MTHGDTTGDFEKTAGWLDWYDGPIHSRRSSCQREPWTPTAMSSVRAGRFPYAPERKYTPCDASAGPALRPPGPASASTAT